MELLADPASAVPGRRARLLPTLRVLARVMGNAQRGYLQSGSRKSSVPPRPDAVAWRLMAIPGLGPIRGDRHPGQRCRISACSRRDATLPLGSGSRRVSSAPACKHSSGGISKKGDRTLRTLLTVGATAHLRYERARDIKDPWLQALLARRPFQGARRWHVPPRWPALSGPCWSPEGSVIVLPIEATAGRCRLQPEPTTPAVEEEERKMGYR